MMIISIIVPVYNEARRLDKCIRDIAMFAACAPKYMRFELIIVDNGSTDNTLEIARGYTDKHIRAYSIPGRGKGAALSYGLTKASGHFVYLADCDLSTPIDSLMDFIQAADSGYDLVIGSRMAPGAILSGLSGYRVLMSHVWRLMVHRAIPETRGILDTQCGFKLLSGKLAGAVHLELKTVGMAWDVELIMFARANKYRVLEIPVTWHNDRDSKVRPIRDSISMASEIMHLARVRKTSPTVAASGRSAVL